MAIKKIKVLIVDDSAFVRKAIKRMLSSAPDIEVVDTASDGQEALKKICALKPDVVTMDVRMPGMDGLAALERIMQESPTPVIMLSSLTQEGAEVTLRALDLGAVDFIDKTRTESSMDLALLADELTAKVRAIAGIDLERLKIYCPEECSCATAGEEKAALPPSKPKIRRSPVDIVAIGTSTGGPPALQSLIPKLPADFPSGIVIVQHMPPGFTRHLAERLNTMSCLEVSEAVHGDIVRRGRVLVAPAGRHLKLRKRGGEYTVHLGSEPAEALHKPSVDVMMQSVAEAAGEKSLGVLLTGMGSDGTAGMKAIKALGGRTIAESEETCIVYGMPKSAIEEGVIDRIVPLYEMVGEILHEVR